MGSGTFLDIKWGVYVVFRWIGPLRVSKSHCRRVENRKWMVFPGKWPQLVDFGGQKSKIFDFFFGSQMSFYMVWGWVGVFINRFWTFMVDFEVTLVSEWLNTSEGIWGLRKISCFWVKIQKNRVFRFSFLGPKGVCIGLGWVLGPFWTLNGESM